MKKFLIVIFSALFSHVFSQEKSVFDVARNGTLEEMKTLYQKNPELINSVDKMSFTPLILATYRGNVPVAKFLIENVKDLNYLSHEGTALAAICINYNKELAELLLQKKANPNIADSTGTTPLIWAVKRGNEELTQLLLQNNADRTMKDEMGITAFEYAVKSQKVNIINLFKNN